jgi:hypothetical protein
MKRIEEFEKLLIEKIDMLERNEPYEGVDKGSFNKFLTGDGMIIYTYTSIRLGCEIKCAYRGHRYYDNSNICIKLTLDYE